MADSKHPGGRPLKFKTVQELEAIGEKYFEETPREEWTITGLALALDTTRKTLVDYDNRDEFSNTIKRFKTKVEHAYELSLRKRGSAGDIFGLKNFNWKDKSEVESREEVTHKFEDLTDEQLDQAIKDREARLLESPE